MDYPDDCHHPVVDNATGRTAFVQQHGWYWPDRLVFFRLVGQLWPVYLIQIDTSRTGSLTLSRWKHGFEFRWGYSGSSRSEPLLGVALVFPGEQDSLIAAVGWLLRCRVAPSSCGITCAKSLVSRTRLRPRRVPRTGARSSRLSNSGLSRCAFGGRWMFCECAFTGVSRCP